MPGRGIENAIRLLTVNPNILLVVLGNAMVQEYLDGLISLANELGVSGRVIFHSAVSYGELWKYAGAADVGLVIHPHICANAYYSLPNKLFENIQSLTPLLGPDFPEISRIIRGYGVGLTCDTENIDSVNQQIERLRTDDDLYAECMDNLRKAKTELNWENEKEALVSAYRHLMTQL